MWSRRPITTQTHHPKNPKSQNHQVSTEISLQPWRAYKTDGVILFSDILTPLPGMGVEFTIEEKQGPKITPIRTWEQVSKRGPCVDVCTVDARDGRLRPLRRTTVGPTIDKAARD